MINLKERINIKQGQYLLDDVEHTNFLYEIDKDLSDTQINIINSDNKTVFDKMDLIKEYGCNLKYIDVENENFKANLQMIDTKFPEIFAEYILLFYTGVDNSVADLTPLVQKSNPCEIKIILTQGLYSYKIKLFLYACICGMTPSIPWNDDSQVICEFNIEHNNSKLKFDIYDINEFQEYLFKNTRFETPSATRYGFGHIYQKNGKNFIKLNLQVRFI